MASAARRSLPAEGQLNGQMNGTQDVVGNAAAMSLPGVDAQQLKARLYSYAPQQAYVNTRALRFNRPTNAQIKKYQIPGAPKLEPLPVLQGFQDRNKPEYIQRKARDKLEQEGFFKDQEPAAKKKRPGSCDPLERPPSATPMLPEDMKMRQETLGHGSMVESRVITPAPPKSEKPKSPRGKIHAKGASSPPSHMPSKGGAHNYNGLYDMHEIIRVIRENPKTGFFYLSPAVPKSTVHYHYYNLTVVDHEHANKLDHCTISMKGVTRMRSDDETEFVPLDRWEQEYIYFQKLVKIPVFSLFRKWKAFSVWRTNVRKKKKVPTATLR